MRKLLPQPEPPVELELPGEPPSGWLRWGLPGIATVRLRDEIRRTLSAELAAFSGVGLSVYAGASVILITLGPATLITTDVVEKVEAVANQEAFLHLRFELFVAVDSL